MTTGSFSLKEKVSQYSRLFLLVSYCIGSALLTSSAYAGIGSWSAVANTSGHYWTSIASSADGIKLAAIESHFTDGSIWTSQDSGATWTQVSNTSGHPWSTITSSADGVKLFATTNYNSSGSMWRSLDSGATWTEIPNTSGHLWASIASSSDGTKVVATDSHSGYTGNIGAIWTSSDSGATWTANPTTSGLTWGKVVSSSDGTKLATMVGYAGIWTSQDSGATWIASPNTSNTWSDIASSADGTSLYAVDGSMYGYIWRSTNSGASWTQVPNTSGQNWIRITSSADGTKLAALGDNLKSLWTSSDSGVTWAKQPNTNTQIWGAIASSADGAKLYATSRHYPGDGYIGTIWSYIDANPVLKVDIMSPLNNSTVTAWTPYVSWGTATTCGYNWDGSENYTTVDCANHGSDIPAPASTGTFTLSLKGTDANATTVLQSTTFTLSLAINIISPKAGIIKTWSPAVNWNPGNFNIGNLTCTYSYDNFTTSHAANCAGDGSDIVAPTEDGNYTLSVKVTDNSAGTGISSVIFTTSGWTPISNFPSYQYAKGITSSADGKKLFTASNGAEGIGISTDSGATWSIVPNTSGHVFVNIASSADGTKLITGDYNFGSLWRSGDSGATWTQLPNTVLPAGQQWSIFTSSADGTKLAAAPLVGPIWRSINSGKTWTQSNSGDKSWLSITSSADGKKLAAVADYSHGILLSSDFGTTWTPAPGIGSETYKSVASSADGTRLVASMSDNHIKISTDSGATWSGQQVVPFSGASAMISSADGTKLAAVEYGGAIYTSIDSGASWTQAPGTNGHAWMSITSAADGTKLAAVAASGGGIWTYGTLFPTLKVDILKPLSNEVVTTWTPLISLGSADTCEYSWDGTNWTNANCEQNGSDIPLPESASGTNTLYVKGSSGGGAPVTKESMFTLDLATAPTVTSPTSTDVTVNSAILGSTIISLGNPASISARGVCVSTSSDPSLTNGAMCFEEGGVTMDTFTQSIGELSSGTTYHYRGYATNDTDTAYSPDATFTTIRVLPVTINSPAGESMVTMWSPSVTWNADHEDINNLTCTYSYDNFDTFQTADCAAGGNDIAIPNADGQNTLSVRVTDKDGLTGTASSSFSAGGWAISESSPVGNWISLASSSDGTKLVANLYYGGLWTSADSGITWNVINGTGGVHGNTDTTSGNWGALASSADGTKLVASNQSNGTLWTSTDSGMTWNEINGSGDVHGNTDTTGHYWYYLASSADGTKLVASDDDNAALWTSTDSGMTWNMIDGSGDVHGNTDTTGNYWSSLVSSADGTKLVASDDNNGALWTSTDSGMTWNEIDGSGDVHGNTNTSGWYWNSVASSDDGTKLIAADQDDQALWTSTDSGMTWNEIDGSGGEHGNTNTQGQNWYSLSSSSDGAKLIAYNQGEGSNVWTSTDSGMTWQSNGINQNWSSVVSSSDGSKLAATVNGGQIYTFQGLKGVPALNTSTSTDITKTGATLGATITSLGRPASISARGVCMSYSPNPSLSDESSTCFTEGETVGGVFTKTVTGLTAGTLYHYRAYATNAAGTAYSPDTTFTTLSDSVQPSSGGGGGGGWSSHDLNTIKRSGSNATNNSTTPKTFSEFVSKTVTENTRTGFATRLETVLLTLKVKGIEMVKDYTCLHFHSDTSGVLVPSYTCQVAEKAKDSGIISATNKEFKPLQSVSRIEAYSMMMKSICVHPITTGDNWQSEVIKKAIELGLTVRTLDTFEPDRPLTVPEMYTIVQKLNAYGKEHKTCQA